MNIETERLLLIPGDIETLAEAIAGTARLSKRLNVTVPDNYSEFGTGPLKYSHDRLLESEKEIGWWTYFPIYKADNKLIGSGGYKGRPSSEGIVELGYEIAPEYRNRGLAGEMTMGLIEHAFHDERVKLVIAHTLAETNPSTRVLTKCGFIQAGEINDPEDGLIWRWERGRK